MRLFQTISELRPYLQQKRCEGEKIGLIPTMGALHEGHLSLVKQSKAQGDLAVASIFVNPTQFNNPEDLEKYPRNLDRDLEMLTTAGCDAVFAPNAKEMYPEPASLRIDFGSLESELEGKFRPGHFAGVGLVVSKLFNIVQPDQAYFGQKDLQQYYVIEKLVNQLSFPIRLHRVPIMREAHGLAMSSRNERLSEADRQESGLLYKALQAARERLLADDNISQARALVHELINSSARLELEYFEVIDVRDFKPLKKVNDQAFTALCIAAEIGQVRLIDNLLLIS